MHTAYGDVRADVLVLESVPTSAVVLSDENLLRRILQNFLSNAIGKANIAHAWAC